MRLRLSVDGDVQLKTRDGTVLGQLESVTVSLDVAAFRAICDAPRGTIGSTAVDVDVQELQEQPSGPVEDATNGQESFLPDPVVETWNVYVEALDRPKAVLTPKVRKWIADAHEKVGPDATREAIRGLAASEYHREHGYIGIEYAIVPKRGETIEGRIEKMTARRLQAPASHNDAMTVDQLVEQFAPEHRQRVVDEILKPIVHSLIEKDDREAVDEGNRQLRRLESYGYKLVIEGERVIGARRK
jgi:hypothetical protein